MRPFLVAGYFSLYFLSERDGDTSSPAVFARMTLMPDRRCISARDLRAPVDND